MVAGVLLCLSVFFVERVLKLDDPVGAVSVHGANGAWGLLALGLFADGTYGDALNGVEKTVRGLFYGDPSQFAAQAIGVIINVLFVGIAWYVFFKILNLVVPMRVSKEVELDGLDGA